MEKSSKPQKPKDEELPEAKLLRADQLKKLGNPEVKTWRMSDLEQDEIKKVEAVRADVMAQVRKELAPEVNRQTTLLKKEAYEKAHQEGYDAGFKKGLELGQKQAFEKATLEAQNQLKPQVERLISLLSFLKSPYQAIEQQVFQSFADLSLVLAQKMIETHIQQDADWVLNAVKEAVALLPEDSAEVEIEMNPQDVALIAQYQADFDQAWVLKKTPEMPLGSCRVKQNFSIVDNIWQKKLSELMTDVKSVAKHVARENVHLDDTPSILSGAPDKSTLA